MSGTSFEEATWPVPNAFPGRPGAAVHVWRISLESAPEIPSDDILSPDEVERASRLRSAALRDRFERSRIALRQILARYLDTTPAELVFEYGESGKPRLAESLAFNLSHSGPLALCAVSETDIGVDIERVRDLRDADRLAERHFSPDELEVWASRAGPERLIEFFRIWTRKEAMLKAAGFGLSRPLDRVDTRQGMLDGVRYWIQDVEPGRGFTGAVASESEATDVRFWSWSSG